VYLHSAHFCSTHKALRHGSHSVTCNYTNVWVSALSGTGPTLYTIMKCDLHALSETNDIFKYADDTTLLVPQHTDIELDIESNHVKSWAATNQLTLNLSKTKELVFKRPRVQHFHMPPSVDDIEQINCCKLLGVIFQSNLKMDPHVQYILSQCAQRMYLLKLLRHHGMSYAQLTVVTYSIIISRILYALPAWGGFLSTELVGKINALFRRLKRFGYLSCNITVSDLMTDSDIGLFRNMYSPSHCLHHMLPCPRMCDNLRDRGHNFQLPTYCTALHKKSFIMRALYNFV